MVQRMITSQPERFNPGLWDYFNAPASSRIPAQPVVVDISFSFGQAARGFSEVPRQPRVDHDH